MAEDDEGGLVLSCMYSTEWLVCQLAAVLCACVCALAGHKILCVHTCMHWVNCDLSPWHGSVKRA